jgi:hypothetical protein
MGHFLHPDVQYESFYASLHLRCALDVTLPSVNRRRRRSAKQNP